MRNPGSGSGRGSSNRRAPRRSPQTPDRVLAIRRAIGSSQEVGPRGAEADVGGRPRGVAARVRAEVPRPSAPPRMYTSRGETRWPSISRGPRRSGDPGDGGSFAREVLAPLAPKVDAEPDPYVGWQMLKPAYAEACRQGIAWSMLPKSYGGGGLSNVDFVIAAEEIQAVDPGFGTAVLVNGLGLMPVWYDPPRSRSSGSSAVPPATRPTSSSSATRRASPPARRAARRTSTLPP